MDFKIWLGDLPAETKESVFEEMRERGYDVPGHADARVRYLFWGSSLGTAMFTDSDRSFYDSITVCEEILVDDFLAEDQNDVAFEENEFLDLLMG